MRVLAILPSLPFPANNGQKHRFSQLLRELARHEEVAILCFADARDRARYGGEHDALFAALRIVPIAASTPAARASSWLSFEPSEVRHYDSAEMRSAVAEAHAGFRPDVVLCGDPALTQYLLPYPRTPRALDYVCEFQLQARRMQDLARGPAKALWAMRRRKFARFLRRIERVYDLCFLNSQEDLDSLRAAWPAVELEVIANGLALAEYPLGLAEPVADRLIYPGSTTYPPNLDAVGFFAGRILPRIRAEAPGAELHVTGAAPPEDARPRADGLVYTGHLPDVRRAIAAAWTCVVPLRLGAGGARLKVLEAMALGTPMVATAIGYEGVAVTDGVDILAAEEPEDFARKTVALLRSPALRQLLAAGGRALVERRYDVAVLGARYRERLRGLRAAPRAEAA
jgi:glycosyltransferase involved in cell wall biosynthesis